MPSALSTYAHINAKIRTRISLLLDDDSLQELRSSSRLAALCQKLAETEYAACAEVFARTGDPGLAELAVNEHEFETYERVISRLPEPPRGFVSALLERFEIEALKAALRLWFERNIRGVSNATKVAYLPKRPWPPGIRGVDLVEAEYLDSIVEALRTSLSSRAPEPVQIPSADSIRSSGSLYTFENALDRIYYTSLFHALRTLGRKDRAVAERLIGFTVDIENIRRIARLKSFYDVSPETIRSALIDIEGRSISEPKADDSIEEIVASRYPRIGALLTGSQRSILARIDLIETALDREAESEVRKILSGNPFTVGIILSYFVLKNREVRAILSIMNEIRYKTVLSEHSR